MTPPSTLGTWRVRPMFISSTFRDMHAERDWLRDRVFPELEEHLRGHRHHLEVIDLRQGVEAASAGGQESRELKVLKVCLAEIERSRPFLVALLGDRYGWTPPPERLESAAREAGFTVGGCTTSVTALEIEFGLLRKSVEQRRRCFFYFRDPLPYDEMPPDRAAEYSDAHSSDPEAPARQAALNALKVRIETDPELRKRVRHYHAGWDHQLNRVTGLEAFGQQVLSDLWGELEAETRAFALATPATWQAQERADLEAFIEYRLRGFIGREFLIEHVLYRILSHTDDTVGLCVTGGPGSGKSSLFARVHRQMKDERDTLVLAHSAGSGPRSTSADDMLRRWVEELANFLHLESELPENAPPTDVERTFMSLLHRAATTAQVVVLVDGLNLFERTTRSKYVTWFHPQRWPTNARILVTTSEGTESEALSHLMPMDMVDLVPLLPDEKREIGNSVWRRYHRECNPQVLETVLAAAASDNPLWLTLAMEQLNLLDGDDFTRAGENLLDLLLAEARALPGDVEGIYATMLAKAERTYGIHWVRPFASLLALSRHGWREADIKGVLPAAAEILLPEDAGGAFSWDPLQFAALRRGVRAHIWQRGPLGQLDFLHAQIRIAIARRYLTDVEVVRRLHGVIADHLLQLPETDPIRLSETMFHLMHAEDGPRAAGFYAHVELPAESTRTLTEALAAEQEDRATWALEWTASLLTERNLDPDTIGNLSERLLSDLHDAIWDHAPLAVRRRLLETVREGLRKLVAADASKATQQQNLCVCLHRLGDVLREQGDLDGANAEYKESAAITQRLAAADPTNTSLQRALGVDHERKGLVLLKQGDLDGALEACRDALAIAQRLAAADPLDGIGQEDLSVRHSAMGDVLRARGDLDGALVAYCDALDIAHALATVRPSNTDWQYGLSICHSKVGGVLREQGNLSGAAEHYQKGIILARRLAATDPSNLAWQQRLSYNCDEFGDVMCAGGQPGRALTAYREGLAVTQRLSRDDPSNLDWQRDVGLSHNKVGDALRAQGDLGGALTSYERTLAVAERLVAADPANADFQRDLYVVCLRMASISRKRGSGGELQWWRKGYDILAGMKKRGVSLSAGDEQILARLAAKVAGTVE